MPDSHRHTTGWRRDLDNGRLYADYEGDEIFYVDGNGLTVASGETLVATTATLSGVTLSGANRLHATTGSFFGLGAAETPTIASGVLTVTKPHVNPLPESSTSDTVDSIVYTGAQEGDLLLIAIPATNTITFDDANINLGAATRAVAPGGSLLLIFDGTQWTELTFITASDNA